MCEDRVCAMASPGQQASRVFGCDPLTYVSHTTYYITINRMSGVSVVCFSIAAVAVGASSTAKLVPSPPTTCMHA